MGRKKKTEPTEQERKLQGLRMLASESPFVWNAYRYGHDWDCPKCGERVFAPSRLKYSVGAAQNNIHAIGQKAQLHLVRGCAPEPRLPERKDLDN